MKIKSWTIALFTIGVGQNKAKQKINRIRRNRKYHKEFCIWGKTFVSLYVYVKVYILIDYVLSFYCGAMLMKHSCKPTNGQSQGGKAEKQKGFQGKNYGSHTDSKGPLFALWLPAFSFIIGPLTSFSFLQHLPSWETVTMKVKFPETSGRKIIPFTLPDLTQMSALLGIFAPVYLAWLIMISVSPNCSYHSHRFLSPFMVALSAAVGWVSVEKGLCSWLGIDSSVASILSA